MLYGLLIKIIEYINTLSINHIQDFYIKTSYFTVCISKFSEFFNIYNLNPLLFANFSELVMNKPLTSAQHSSKIPSTSTHKTLKTLSIKTQGSQDQIQVSTRVLDVLVPPVFDSLIKKTPFVTFSPKETTIPSVQKDSKDSKESCLNINLQGDSTNVKTEPSSPVASKESTFKIAAAATSNIRQEILASPKNFRTEPSSPVESRDSTPDKSFHSSKSIQSNKSFHSSKSMGANSSGLQGILKRKEKSRFSFHSKRQGKNKRQASAPRVIIIEGFYDIPASAKGKRNV